MKRTFPIVLLGLLLGAAVSSAGAEPPTGLDASKLKLASANALILDAASWKPIYAKSPNEVTPIASLTKLMTAIVVLDGGQSLDEPIAIEIGRAHV